MLAFSEAHFSNQRAGRTRGRQLIAAAAACQLAFCAKKSIKAHARSRTDDCENALEIFLARKHRSSRREEEEEVCYFEFRLCTLTPALERPDSPELAGKF